MYRGMPHEKYFADMERIFLRHGGRPHWGKLHTLTSQQLRIAYPKWDSFLEIREKMDPDGLFLSPYLKRIFAL
jgi:FAD/FMN-containing dehydrogenase